MESDLAVDALLLYLIAKESKNISEEERKSIYQQLILLSVMSEKFSIKQWEQDEKLQSIFLEVQSMDKDFTAKTRDRCWDKPWGARCESYKDNN